MKRLLLICLLTACHSTYADHLAPATPPSPDAGSGMPRTHIDVESRDGRAFGLEVELALNNADRERGLMFRRNLADGTGMLFIFPKAEPHNFWMKNTLIPLDMIFAAADGAVMGCVARAEPLTLTGRSVPGNSRYVLEVPGGWCAEHGIAPGAKLLVGEAGQRPVE